jgi:PBP1b-binding outer membrane lipoprotein LpoB
MGIKEEENFRGTIMRKTLKIVVMLLVVAAVVFAAGCAGKTNTAENKTQEAPNQTTPAETPATTPEVATTPAETPATTPEIISNGTQNITGNTTVQNVTHMSNAQRKLAIAQNHTKSSGTQNVSP